MTVHHLGIIVRDLEKKLIVYSKLGYDQVSEILFDNIQQNKVVFLQNHDYTIELIEPLNEKSSIYNFKEGYHHICYEIDNIDMAAFLRNFKLLKIGKIFTKPILAPAINNRKIVFACLNNGMFIELLF